MSPLLTKAVVAAALSTCAVAAWADELSFSFVTADQGRAVLTARDDFVAALSPFDRAARLKSAAPVSEAQYLAHVGRSVVQWEPAPRARVEAALKALKPSLARLKVPLPPTVMLINTTGQEEGQAEYTRDDAIVLPRPFLAGTDKNLEFVIAHELFHILSRRNPELREDLYEDIGFEPCTVALPEALGTRKITNPDAPLTRHCIEVTWRGDDYRALPVLYADAAAYDPARGGEFFEYLQFRLVLDTSKQAESPAGSARLVKLDGEIGRFYEQVGNNTTYVIHPEEILADNFAQVVTDGPAPVTPAIHERIRKRLLRD
jgi:hypothetical protein